MLIVNVKVILHDPTLRQLEVPAVLGSDGHHDPSRFPGFENDHRRIVLRVFKVRINKVITPSLGGIQNGHAPFLATVFEPVLELLGDIA